MCEAIGAKALHPPTLVVHTNQSIRAHTLDVIAQGRELLAVCPVAGKQDHAATQRVRQAATVGVAERGASDVQNQGGVFHSGHGSSSGLFNYDMAGGVVGFVTEGDMGTQLPRVEPFLQSAMQHDGGLAAGQTPHLTMPPSHGHSHPQSDGFAEGLFHRKTCCQKTHPTVWPTGASDAKGLHLGLTQHFLGKAFAVAIEGGTDAADVANISADAINLAHG